MAHKRATRSARERARRVADLAPKIAIEHEPVPKSASRILDAEQIRRDYRKRKRHLDGVNDSGEGVNGSPKQRYQDAVDMRDPHALRINPGETVTQFNRRVESSMMPLVKSALRQSATQARKLRREEATQEMRNRGKHEDDGHKSKKDSDPSPAATSHAVEMAKPQNTKEFQMVPTSVPRRLNDVAQEPPVIKILPRGATRNDATTHGVLSMAQKAMMEEEREKAIRHYRELKARKGRGAVV